MPVVCLLPVGAALFLFLQTHGAYHFLYLDQQNMLLHDPDRLLSFLTRPAGMVAGLNALMIQYFTLPCAGALTVAALLTLAGLLTAAVIRRIAPHANLSAASLLPVAAMLFPVFDVNYSYAGILACCMMTAVLYGFLGIRRSAGRLAYALVAAAVLFWLAGAVALLFAVCILLRELLNRFARAYMFLLPLLLIAGLTAWSVRCSWVAGYRFLLLPDGYFTHLLRPGIAVYASWICLTAVLLTACLLRRRKLPGAVRKWGERLVLLTLVAGVAGYGMMRYVDRKDAFFKELDYYARTEQWDRIIARCRGKLSNYLYKSYLNLALAEKGELAERMFTFDQSGPKGLLPPKNRAMNVSVILSDIYFSMGYIALAQQMAFEANMSMTGDGNPRMYRRLIQTNLILGAYPVAEKYIALLEKTHGYRSWATAQRRFLWNDAAVEADPLLGIKRKCIPAENALSEIYGLDFYLKRIARQAPEHRATIQYAGALYLLEKNMTAFRDLLETSYGTEVLPVLPKAFQEAIIILSERDPGFRERFPVSEATMRRYDGFRKQVLAHRKNTAALPALMYRSFGDTYWYYFMFKKND
jgi:hypothetical protein